MLVGAEGVVFGLEFYEVGEVAAFFVEEFFMGAFFDDVAVFDYDEFVGVAEGGEAVGDGDYGFGFVFD